MKTKNIIQLTIHKSNVALLAAAVLVAGIGSSSAALEFDLVSIGKPAGASSASARQINDSGQVTLGASFKIDRYTSVSKAAVWQRSIGFTLLAPLSGDTGASAFAINNQGVVGGYSTLNGNLVAVIWQPDVNGGYAAPVDLNALLPAVSKNWLLSWVAAIANDGTNICVFATDGAKGYNEAVLLEMSSAPAQLAIVSVTALGSFPTLAGPNSPFGMNDSVQICGSAFTGEFNANGSPRARAFFWDPANRMMVNLSPDQGGSSANAINGTAQMVGQYTPLNQSYGYRAALWQWQQSGQFFELSDLGTLGTSSSSRCQLLGLNNAAVAVGWSDTGSVSSKPRAVIWDWTGGLRLLNPLVKNSTVVLNRANAINQNFQILATAELKAGVVEPVLLTPR